jgi:uncharacterized protein YciI
MFFVIHAFDKPDALEKRLAHYEAHKAFLADTAPHGVAIAMSGPLVKDDGKTAIGSLLIIEAQDRASAEAFNRADPFHAAGIWQDVHITAFVRRQG